MSNHDFDFAIRIYRHNGEVGSSVLAEEAPNPVTGRPMFNDAMSVFFDQSYIQAFPDLRLALRIIEEALERIVYHANVGGGSVPDALIYRFGEDLCFKVSRQRREVVEERDPWSKHVIRRFVREKTEKDE